MKTLRMFVALMFVLCASAAWADGGGDDCGGDSGGSGGDSGQVTASFK